MWKSRVGSWLQHQLLSALKASPVPQVSPWKMGGTPFAPAEPGIWCLIGRIRDARRRFKVLPSPAGWVSDCAWLRTLGIAGAQSCRVFFALWGLADRQ